MKQINKRSPDKPSQAKARPENPSNRRAVAQTTPNKPSQAKASPDRPSNPRNAVARPLSSYTTKDKAERSLQEEDYAAAKINREHRRLDTLAGLFQGNTAAAAVCFDGRNLVLALNLGQPTELVTKLSDYLQLAATIDYDRSGFWSELNLRREELFRYVEAQDIDGTLHNWVDSFKTNLFRVEASIHGGRIEKYPHRQQLFQGEEYAPSRAFSEEVIEAFQQRIKFLSNDEGVHAELKITQHLLYNSRTLNELKRKKPFYIGVSKKCCGKCEASIKAVNEAILDRNIVRASIPSKFLDLEGDRLPGSGLVIVTREALIGQPGSEEFYPSPIPPFLDEGATKLKRLLAEGELYTKIMARLRSSMQMLDVRSLKNYFELNNVRGVHLPHDKEHFSPTTNLHSANIQPTPKIASGAPMASSMAERSSAIIEKLEIPVPDEVKPFAGREDEGEKMSPVETTEIDSAAEELAYLVTRKNKPIVIFYQDYTDPSCARTLNSVLDNLKERGIRNLALYSLHAEISDGANLREALGTLISKDKGLIEREKQSFSSDDSAKLRDIVYLKAILNERSATQQAIESAESKEIQVFNIRPSQAEITEAFSASTSQLSQLSGELDVIVERMVKNKGVAILNDTTPEGIKRLKHEIYQQLCKEESGERIFSKNMDTETSKLWSQFLFRDIANIYDTQEGGVVAVVNWDQAKGLEQKFIESGYSNITSFFIRDSRIPNLIEKNNYFNDVMIKYNPDYVNSSIMPNSILMDTSTLSPEVIKEQIVSCLRVPVIERVEEYQPGFEIIADTIPKEEPTASLGGLTINLSVIPLPLQDNSSSTGEPQMSRAIEEAKGVIPPNSLIGAEKQGKEVVTPQSIPSKTPSGRSL